MKHVLGCLLMFWLFGSLTAWGQASDRSVTIGYIEPTTNSDGTALEDLAFTRIYQDVTPDGKAGIVMDIDATRPGGGGFIKHPVCVEILDESMAESINYRVSALDMSGNESGLSDVVKWPVPGTQDCEGAMPDVTPPAMPSDFRLMDTTIP